MRPTLIAVSLLALASPLAAQLTTSYAGIQRDGGKEVPATAVFAVEKGRVAMIMTGTQSARMLFDEKAQVLRIVLDDQKSYVDLDKDWHKNNDATAAMAGMQKQLEQMPPAQRAMAEQMMRGRMGGMTQAPPQLEYVWTNDKQKIAGYDCTRVEGMRGPAKVTEYCGSTSDDFKLSDVERQTVLAMQGYLRDFTIAVKDNDNSMRAFQWDTKVDGYPVLTRCLKDGKVTLDLTLQSVTRKPLADSIFAVPSGFKKIEMPKMSGR
jgi:hypothetical protein